MGPIGVKLCCVVAQGFLTSTDHLWLCDYHVQEYARDSYQPRFRPMFAPKLDEPDPWNLPDVPLGKVGGARGDSAV